MKKYLGIIVALIGIAFLAFNIYITAKEEGMQNPIYLILGGLLTFGGVLYNSWMVSKGKFKK
ncbi:MAG: hypothetical protein AAF840_13445 [Bacteroidota bacterium]